MGWRWQGKFWQGEQGAEAESRSTLGEDGAGSHPTANTVYVYLAERTRVYEGNVECRSGRYGNGNRIVSQLPRFAEPAAAPPSLGASRKIICNAVAFPPSVRGLAEPIRMPRTLPLAEQSALSKGSLTKIPLIAHYLDTGARSLFVGFSTS